jgi:tRNA A-37 threonylcarbamoyl transferase component Bud32
MTGGQETASGIAQLKVGEPFPSRKNRVFRVGIEGKICIAKVFNEEFLDRARIEYDVLVSCHSWGLRVPSPIWFRENTILMEYVDGINLGVSLDALFPDGNGRAITSTLLRRTIVEGLASWLASFHRAYGFGFCRGDCILKNFILSGDQIYGIDFEEAGQGDHIADLGQACSYILSTRPMFTQGKFEFMNDLANRYWMEVGKDRSAELSGAVAEALEHYARYRSEGPKLLEWAERIRKSGFPSERS